MTKLTLLLEGIRCKCEADCCKHPDPCGEPAHLLLWARRPTKYDFLCWDCLMTIVKQLEEHPPVATSTTETPTTALAQDLNALRTPDTNSE